MLFMLRIIEWGWLAVAAVSLYEVILRWGSFTVKFYLFIATLVIALLMFFLRRKSRLAYQRRLKERADPKA